MYNCNHLVLHAGFDVHVALVGIRVPVAATDVAVVGWRRARSHAETLVTLLIAETVVRAVGISVTRFYQ